MAKNSTAPRFVHSVGLDPGPVCTVSTIVLAEGCTRVASVLDNYVRPTITHRVAAETRFWRFRSSGGAWRFGHARQERSSYVLVAS